MHDTALVLGGGGPVGGAWMTGVLAGLTEAGVDLDRADVIIGTSAGAIFGARLAAGEARPNARWAVIRPSTPAARRPSKSTTPRRRPRARGARRMAGRSVTRPALTAA